MEYVEQGLDCRLGLGKTINCTYKCSQNDNGKKVTCSQISYLITYHSKGSRFNTRLPDYLRLEKIVMEKQISNFSMS